MFILYWYLRVDVFVCRFICSCVVRGVYFFFYYSLVGRGLGCRKFVGFIFCRSFER